MVPPAIVVLYFLKLRRQPVEVPSTFLWRRSVEDLHVNSIWQRLRQNLLLLLQLLVVLLAILALLRPGWRGTELAGNRFVFLIDRSASMSATDQMPNRLEMARQRVLELIDQMESGSQAMVIGFSDTAQVAQQFTDNRRLLRQAVRRLGPTARRTSLLGALELAAGLANPGRIATEAGDEQVADALPATLYVLSDGKFNDVESRDFSLGNLTPVFVPIGRSDTPNVAVTALSNRAQLASDEQRQVFARVRNFGDNEVTVPVELFFNDALVDADELTVPPNGSSRIVFDLVAAESGTLRLTLNHEDALALDNQAFAVIHRPRQKRVLFVSPGNDIVWWALVTERVRRFADVERMEPEELETPNFRQAAASGQFDLVIFDRCRPAEMPEANTLFIGTIPNRNGWEAESVAAPQIIDTDASHPVMHLVHPDEILIGEALALDPPPGSGVLIDSDRGALCAIHPRAAFEDLVLGFDIVRGTDDGQKLNTNWPLGRLSFPTFLLNVLYYLTGSGDSHSTDSVLPGQPVVLESARPTGQLQVVLPDGQREVVLADRHGTFQFHRTEQTGIYDVRESGDTQSRFAVNLFSESESNVAARVDDIQIGYVDVEGQTQWRPARREIWKSLLLVALGVLLFEWYIYYRRISI